MLARALTRLACTRRPLAVIFLCSAASGKRETPRRCPGAVSQVVGSIKGKSAIHMARVYGERKRNFVGQHFWARGFCVNTVGRDEEAIRAYIRNQEKEDQRLEQMNLSR